MEYIYIVFIILLVCFILINLYYYSSNQNDNNLTETTKLNNDNVIEELLKNKKNIVYIVDANNIDWLLLNKAIKICNNNQLPLIIKNGIKYFPKLKNFNHEYIEKYYNSKKYHKYHKYYTKTLAEYTNLSERIETDKHSPDSILIDNYTLNYLDSNYIKNIKNNKNSLLFRRELINKYNNTCRNITNELSFPNPIFKKNDLKSYIFYNGYKNTGVMPHAHKISINILVKGCKKWLFLNKEQVFSLGTTYNPYNKDKLNYINWYNKYIKSDIFSKYIEFIQNTGDIVIVPEAIYHSIINIEDSIGIVLDL